MKIEILYPALASFYGEAVGLRYLKQCLPDAEWIETELFDTPAFTKEKVDLVYLGPMTENGQELVIRELRPYIREINDYIESGAVFIAVGNALEIFGKYIENEDGSRIDGLGLFDTCAKRKMMDRYNSLYLGRLGDRKIVGFKAQFTHTYPLSDVETLFENVRGPGLNPDHRGEGLRRKNFMGTYLLGPLFVTNPDFTKYVMELLGVEKPSLPFEKDVYAAYEKKLKEFEKPETKYQYD